MEDAFFVADTEEMSRAFDPQNLDAPVSGAPSIAPIRRSVPSHPVCPFCGTINEAPGAPCRQCGMENSQATRAATRAKLGPWYVWQTKNPAAPGMNFATLLNLVERGRVTPRSIVRGPTTHQLWRYAARVKGLSREFCACWGCGAEVTKTARVCPSCKRLQQPPINPDVLLETGDAAQTSPTRPIADPFTVSPTFGRQSQTESHTEAQPEPRPATPAATPEPARAFPSARAAMKPTFATMPSSLPVVDMGDAPLAEGMELAAFNLPRESGPVRKGAGRRIFKGIVLAFLLAAISAGVTIYFNPKIAPQYSAWMHAAVGKIGNLFKSGDKPRLEQSSGAAVTVVTGDATAHSPAGGSSSAGTPAHVAPSTPAPTTPAVTTPPPDPVRPAPRETIIISPAPVDPAVAVKQAWDWHAAAISAEERDDYATAVKHYEAILNLHLSGVGPTDVPSRLANARRLLPAGK